MDKFSDRQGLGLKAETDAIARFERIGYRVARTGLEHITKVHYSENPIKDTDSKSSIINLRESFRDVPPPVSKSLYEFLRIFPDLLVQRMDGTFFVEVKQRTGLLLFNQSEKCATCNHCRSSHMFEYDASFEKDFCCNGLDKSNVWYCLDCKYDAFVNFGFGNGADKTRLLYFIKINQYYGMWYNDKKSKATKLFCNIENNLLVKWSDGELWNWQLQDKPFGNWATSLENNANLFEDIGPTVL